MLKKLSDHPVAGKLLGSILAVFGTAIGVHLLGLWPKVKSLVGSGLHALTEPTAVPNWGLLLLVLLALAGIAVLALAFVAARQPEVARMPWTAYTQDTFFGVRWRWSWSSSGSGVHRLVSFCPNCDYQLSLFNNSPFNAVDRIGFHCDSCNRDLDSFDGTYDQIESKVIRFIQQKARNGSWPPAS